jgi:hypothetical protein
MSTVRYRITTPTGFTVVGPVQGSGGLVGGQSEKERAGGLAKLRHAANGGAFYGYQPTPGHVRVYPWYSARGNGPIVDVCILDATIELVE